MFPTFPSWSFSLHLIVSDADKVAHAVYSPGSQAVNDIVNEFGSDVLVQQQEEKEKEQAEIDRKKLGSIVFADRSAMSVRT